jgi:hypothetical protein
MTQFDDRERAFEKKFEKDQELQFKVNARKNRLLGMWAAGQLGKTGGEAEAYAKDVVLADFDKPGDDDVIGKVAKDLAAKGLDVTAVRRQANLCLAEAKKQLMGEAT